MKLSILRIPVLIILALGMVIGFYAYQGSSLRMTEAAAPPPPHYLTGWAWSDTIGWISLNCKDLDTTPATPCDIDYKVEFKKGTKTLVGYGWSDNIGWVKFGNLSFPTSFPYGTKSNATVDTTNSVLHGWARACAGSSLGSCDSASRIDGWDGWIALNSTETVSPSPAYAAKVKNLSPVQWTGVNGVDSAWGGEVVGWVDFSMVKAPCPTDSISQCIDTNGDGIEDWKTTTTNIWCEDTTDTELCLYQCTPQGCIDAPKPTGTLDITPTRVRKGNTVSIVWTATDAVSCKIEGNGQNPNPIVLLQPMTGGTVTSSAINAQTTFTLKCSNVTYTDELLDTKVVNVVPDFSEQ